MKKLLLLLVVFALTVIVPSSAFAKAAAIWASAVNGGGTGALDAVECEDIVGDNSARAIATGDIALVVDSSGVFRIYRYDSTGTDSEEDNGPYDPIVPDDRAADCSGNGQWDLITSVALGRTSEPAWIFRDSDNTDNDDNVKVYVNCTDTGSGTEDCNYTIAVQIAGALTDVFQIDSDGYMRVITQDLDIVAGILRFNGTQIATTNLSDGTAIDPDQLNGDVTDDNLVDVVIMPTAAPSNGDTTHVSTADQIYDFCETTQAYYNAIGDLPTAVVSDGDSTHIPTSDNVYDFCETTQDYLKTSEFVGADEVYSSGWAADTSVPEKDDIYDYLHNFDADDDGSFTDETWYTNLLDGTATFTDFNGAVIDSDNYVSDSIDDSHINWGSGANQVDLADIPGGTAPANAFNFAAATVTLGTVAGTITDGTATWNAAAHTLAGFVSVSAADYFLSDASPTIDFTDSTDGAGGVIQVESINANVSKMYFGVDEDTPADNVTYMNLDGEDERVELNKPLMVFGTISGNFPVGTDSNGKTMTQEECKGSVQLATGAGTWVLPDIDDTDGIGWSVIVYSTTAAAVVVDPDNQDTITYDGVAGDAGENITSESAAGDFVCLVVTSCSSDVANWTVFGSSGSWTPE